VVGDGSQQDSLRRLAHDLQLSGIVDFCGYIPHSSPLLVDYYRLADVFLHPNREMPGGEAEGFGLVFLEASACGIPVIGGSTGGVVEAVEHGQTGFLVKGDDPKQLAAATLRILTEPGLAAQMAQSGLGKARRASWQSQAELFQSFCREIACRRRLQEDND
jgi:phosphatidylinositol alpha-1,6-mannosyltransferase